MRFDREKREQQEDLDEVWFNLGASQARLALKTRRHLSFRRAPSLPIETLDDYREAYRAYLEVQYEDMVTFDDFSQEVMDLTVKRRQELNQAIDWMPRRQRFGNIILALRGGRVPRRHKIAITCEMNADQLRLQGLFLLTDPSQPTKDSYLKAAENLLSEQLQLELGTLGRIRTERFPEPPPVVGGGPILSV